ncbi:hypothetical protein ACFY5H_22700 [Streptomyces sp. NPDC013012]|uniref:hypothetical protein n=1 Tax=Streptomyces sp. NPDC013012 TaxID=3364860 RepID=UPI0036C46CA5
MTGEPAAPLPPRSYRTARRTAAGLVLLDGPAGPSSPPGATATSSWTGPGTSRPRSAGPSARRTAFGSLTVLGDLARGTTPRAARDWRAQPAHPGKPEARVVPLALGHRVPAAIADLADRLPPHLDADGEATVHRTADLPAGARTAVRAARAEELPECLREPVPPTAR